MTDHEWQCQPLAEQWLYHTLDDFKSRNSALPHLEKELLNKTSTRLFDWIDHITLDTSPHLLQTLEESGFIQESAMSTYRLFTHAGAKLPSVVVRESGCKHPLGVAIKVESLADFLMVHRLETCIEGSLYAPYRRALIHQEGECALLCVERRASRTLEPIYQPENALDDYLTSKERLQSRRRDSMEDTLSLVEELISILGKESAAWITLEVEREYWQSRNRAAQFQKNRQDSVGMGWANHDHHTFRSSRTHFAQLVRLFETLGFQCRERFYAGAQAGWGAQIMEQPTCGLILFLDVDLAPEELTLDFAHHPLAEKESLGTVGLWCGLHGDSLLQAGMHHLEAQFHFDQLRNDLSQYNIAMMDPFSQFPYLKQAFTEGEMWPVDPLRVENLFKKGLITRAQADQFITHGALGSHLENLQRDEGYKGFNKENVSLIIKKTDPRLQKA